MTGRTGTDREGAPPTPSEVVPFGAIPRERRLSDKVVDAIVDTIASRQLRPGDTLPSERELGKQFGVSRTVIREAVRALSAQGLLTVKIGSGTKVIAVGTDGISESIRHFVRGSMLEYGKVAEIRRLIEIEAARLAAERATKQDIAAIQTAFARATALGEEVEASEQELEASEQDLEAFVRADLEFRHAIALATRNELFSVLQDSIAESLLEIRWSDLSRRRREVDVADVSARHRAILEAIVSGDPDAAGEAMAAHLAALDSGGSVGRARVVAASSAVG